MFYFYIDCRNFENMNYLFTRAVTLGVNKNIFDYHYYQELILIIKYNFAHENKLFIYFFKDYNMYEYFDSLYALNMVFKIICFKNY